MRKTRIVCTIGPKTRDLKSLKTLIDAGMNIVRLNGSHSDLEWHAETIRTIRQLAINIPVLLDLPGRKIRTSSDLQPRRFQAGEEIIFTTDPDPTNSEWIGLNSKDVHTYLKNGNTILADDGTLQFQVKSIDGRQIICVAKNEGTLRAAKGINLPYVRLESAIVTDRDQALIEMAKNEKVDFIGLSFVDEAADVHSTRKLLEGSGVGIISKIENQFAMDNLEEIAEASDALLIDRGDLGAETDFEKVSVYQKKILKTANQLSKPVIVATEMLHHMIDHPMPTKAEVNDITNAIFDGCSAITLSGETAVGKFPDLAVKTMDRIARTIEPEIEPHESIQKNGVGFSKSEIAELAAQVAQTSPVSKIVCLTMKGFAPSVISKFRLRQPIIAVTPSPETARQLSLNWGVIALPMELDFEQDQDRVLMQIFTRLYSDGLIRDEDLILVTAVRFPTPGAKSNSIELHHVADLRKHPLWDQHYQSLKQEYKQTLFSKHSSLSQ